MPTHSQSNLHRAIKSLEDEHLQSYHILCGLKREPWGPPQHFAFHSKDKQPTVRQQLPQLRCHKDAESRLWAGKCCSPDPPPPPQLMKSWLDACSAPLEHGAFFLEQFKGK